MRRSIARIACWGTDPSVPRLGIRGSDHLEGLHGLALGGPGGWGGWSPVPTTTFPQAIGLAETWDPEVVQRAAAIEGYEARSIFQNSRYKRGGLVIRAPNSDLGRDPRWGRTEECYGEDPFFNGTMAVAFVRGLQGDHPVYWQTASLLKHSLANSNEDNRGSTSSNFDERLLREYYSVPFRMGIVEGGARAYMTAYNAVNGIPCTVHPILRAITIEEWGQDGIICTDADTPQRPSRERVDEAQCLETAHDLDDADLVQRRRRGGAGSAQESGASSITSWPGGSLTTASTKSKRSALPSRSATAKRSPESVPSHRSRFSACTI
jgi:beta-glucosidase-like glycosyl hydrolase